MMEHQDRAHALLGPSKAYQWMACTPSARLEEGFPDTTSEAAEEGTLAHELAELKVRNYFYSVEFGKRKLTAAINKLKKDHADRWQEEMMGYTDEYLEFIRGAALALPSAPYVAIEKQVDLTAYIPDGFGTADCILIHRDTIHVIDFKYGKNPNGRVSAERNPQMQLYALGAYEAYRMFYPIRRIRMSIVQPRLPDGITTWETTLEDLLVFGEEVKEKAALAMKGEGEFAPSEKTCRYCRAKGKCRARAEENVRLAFADGYQKKPPLISNEELGEYLRQGTDLSKWLSDLQDIALKECLAGNEVPGWKAVEGRGSRDWTNLDQAFQHLEEEGVPEAILWERKPVTPAALEKALGKKEYTARTDGYVLRNRENRHWCRLRTTGRPLQIKYQQKKHLRRKWIMNDLTRVTTGEVRLSYVHLFKPYAFQPGQEEKFSVTVLIPKTDTATKARIDAAIEAAKQRGITDKWNGACPPILPIPIYDGDGVRPSDGMEFGPECKGHWVMTASAKADYPPEVVDAGLNPIINQSEVYSGMYGRVNVSFFPYAFGGKKGIGCGLGPVQKTRDGEPLGGSAPSAAQAFGDPGPQPATPSYGAAQPATPGAAGYAATYGAYNAPGAPQPAAGINPLTGLPY